VHGGIRFICWFISRPKTQRARRALKQKDPKLVENGKRLLTLKGQKTGDIVSQALKDLVSDLSIVCYS
jgi:ribosome production factor 2